MVESLVAGAGAGVDGAGGAGAAGDAFEAFGADMVAPADRAPEAAADLGSVAVVRAGAVGAAGEGGRAEAPGSSAEGVRVVTGRGVTFGERISCPGVFGAAPPAPIRSVA